MSHLFIRGAIGLGPQAYAHQVAAILELSELGKLSKLGKRSELSELTKLGKLGNQLAEAGGTRGQRSWGNRRGQPTTPQSKKLYENPLN